MGRKVMRVPMDFDWPLSKRWEGYLLPEALQEEKCTSCDNGMSIDGSLLMGVAFMLTGLGDDLRDQANGRQMHPYLTPLYNISYCTTQRRPTKRWLELLDGLDPQYNVDSFLGATSSDIYRMGGRLAEFAGLDEDWLACSTCEGHSTTERYPGQRAEAAKWEPTDPPQGEGWQMWETVSEGSPVSPVFATPEELARYCADHVPAFGRQYDDYETWLRTITTGDIIMVDLGNGMYGI